MKNKYNWWTKPNPEGVSNKDVVLVFLAGLGIFCTMLGVYLLII